MKALETVGKVIAALWGVILVGMIIYKFAIPGHLGGDYELATKTTQAVTQVSRAYDKVNESNIKASSFVKVEVTNASVKVEATINKKDLSTMYVIADTLFMECKNQTDYGRKAVASVIYNRAGGDKDKFAEVCLKKNRRGVHQFSCYNKNKCDGHQDMISWNKMTVKEKKIYANCEQYARQMVEGTFSPINKTMNMYYNPKACKKEPSWGSKMIYVVWVGKHKFGYLPEHDGYNI